VPLFPSLVTVLTLILYLILIVNVGRARAKYKISPPEISGDPNFERVFRVQQNTLEQLILFLPALWLFSQFVSPVWGAAIGSVWLVGRSLYAWGYYQAAEKRMLGFAMGTSATFILLGGSLIAIVIQLVNFL
jgi:uncharacterized membrane protein YecN with MAPEG domain